MAPCMGPMSPVRAYSLWAGLCPEKLAKQNKTDRNGCGETKIIYKISKNVLIIVKHDVNRF